MYCNNNDYEDKKERNKKDETCVVVNIFCDDEDKKYSKEYDEYKKDDERKKDNNNCVVINVFCDKCKKN